MNPHVSTLCCPPNSYRAYIITYQFHLLRERQPLIEPCNVFSVGLVY